MASASAALVRAMASAVAGTALALVAIWMRLMGISARYLLSFAVLAFHDRYGPSSRMMKGLSRTLEALRPRSWRARCQLRRPAAPPHSARRTRCAARRAAVMARPDSEASA